MVENALDLSELPTSSSEGKKQSNILLSVSHHISIHHFDLCLCLCNYSPFFMEPGDVVQHSNIAFDLEPFKRVPINLEMQITGPEDCCGALRSERTFDGVRFKRIITVWRNEK